jgi:hypothetical protein
VVVEGVDVVADNAARISVFLRTGCVRCSWWLWRRCWRRHRKVGCVVPDNIDAGGGWYHDRHIGRKCKAANKISPTAKQGAS